MIKNAKENSFNPSSLKKGEIQGHSDNNPLCTFDKAVDKIFPGKSNHKLFESVLSVDTSNQQKIMEKEITKGLK